jgi:hypothetical protein
MHTSDGCVCVCVCPMIKVRTRFCVLLGLEQKEDYATFMHYINCAVLFHNFPLRTVSLSLFLLH